MVARLYRLRLGLRLAGHLAEALLFDQRAPATDGEGRIGDDVGVAEVLEMVRPAARVDQKLRGSNARRVDECQHPREQG